MQNGSESRTEKTDSPHESRTDETRLLVRFLRDRDAVCPACGYNLRDLTQGQCPECSEKLSLTVGYRKLHIGLLLIAITPSIFSGICGLLLLLVIMVEPGAPPEAILLDLFGLASGGCGIVLYAMRDRFVAQRRSIQAGWAFLTWTIHVGVLIVLFATSWD